MKSKDLSATGILALVFLVAACDDPPVCQDCAPKQQTSQFEGAFLRFLITKPEEHGGSFLQLDSIANTITEYKSCDSHDYSMLNDTKIIRANGAIYKSCDGSGANYVKIENYSVLDYCTPPFQMKNGAFTLQNRWEVLYITAPDTVLYVPCEAYPTGANVTVKDDWVFFGYTSANDFGGRVIIKSPNQIQFEDIVIGLFVATEAEIRFQERLLALLSANTNTDLYYVIEKNTLTIENPLNNYAVVLITL